MLRTPKRLITLYAQHFFFGIVLRCFMVVVDGGNTRGTGGLRKISCNRAVNAPSTPTPVSAEVSVNGMPILLAFALPCSVDTSRFASAWLPTKMKAGSCCVFSCTCKNTNGKLLLSTFYFKHRSFLLPLPSIDQSSERILCLPRCRRVELHQLL